MTQSSPAPNDCPEPRSLRASLPTLLLHEAAAPDRIDQACIDIVLLHEPDARP